MTLLFFHLCAFVHLALAQLTLPDPPFLPPSPEDASKPTGSDSIPNEQWSNLLGNLVYYYDEQRSGKLPASNRVDWRNDSSLDDGQDMGLDLSGGYYDAGDYIKATYPLSFTLMSICWGAMEYGKGYDLANQTPYLDSMLRWGLDWLMLAHPDDRTLIILVGNPETDDDYWGGDRDIPTPRFSYPINDTHPGTDAAAGASAAFSACSALYSGRKFSSSPSGPASLQDKSYASTLLTHAKTLYDFAENASGGQTLYQNSVPTIARSYPSSDYHDELTMAALFLAVATNSADYYNQAENYYKNSQIDKDDTFNWDTKTPGIVVLFSKFASSNPDIGGDFSRWQGEAEKYFDGIVNGKSGSLTDGGLLYYEGDSDDASLNPALSAAMLLNMYSPLASSDDKSSAYTSFATSQLNYALGQNPMSCMYIVGSSPNSPKNPHSAISSGGNDVSKIDTEPPEEAYILFGSIVGGPDKQDRYYDIRSDWPETEPGLDINSPMLTLAALHVMNDSSDPFYTTLDPGAYDAAKPSGKPCDEAFPCDKSIGRLSKGKAAAIAIIIIVVGLGIIGGFLYWSRLSRKHKKNPKKY
ncbi:Six-hairpin glycosidase [Fomitiporia mediterranea MF3/22]|uniref:Six-hairpin glycosidase n=1 Tax=Fomitiporia mediterranea (strain MF3/22) TaxID=694068 RepID=UPI0004408DE1|nr:Six-hairpin glycosidase [Fomitiporia mediterranea MF3/22]EJD00966.1 Six-hairpin glycosidase [Fomitiporia mediterranea MF3/22]